MASNSIHSQLGNNSNSGLATALLERKIRELDQKINSLALENNELHKRNGRKINRVMLIASKMYRKSKEGMPSYLIIVIVISVIAIGVIGYLAYKHFKGKNIGSSITDALPSTDKALKEVTDSI